MAMTDKMNELKKEATANPAPAPAPAPQAQPMKDAVNKKGGNAKIEHFKNKGALIRQNMSEDQRALECSKSDKVAFVACLANPAKIQQRKVKQEYVKSYQVVGYKFKALEDMEVPVADFKEGCTDLLDVNNTGATRPVKAGEEFDLNIVETTMLISQVLYGGFFSGEGRVVYIMATSSQTRKNPTPCLKLQDGSIKENMIMIAEMVGQTNGHGGRAEIKPEYAKFAELFKKRATRRTGGSSAKTATGEATRNTAAAFRELFGVK